MARTHNGILMLRKTAEWDEGALGPDTIAISMGADFSVTDAHLNAIAAKCPNLVELSAGSQDSGAGSRCSAAAVKNLASSCTQLRSLGLYSFTQVDDAAAIHVAKCLPNLQELSITGHDRSEGKVRGQLLRALAGDTDDYEARVKAAEQDFLKKVKASMRDIIDRERKKEGKPPLKEEEKRRQAAKAQRKQAWEADREAAKQAREEARKQRQEAAAGSGTGGSGEQQDRAGNTAGAGAECAQQQREEEYYDEEEDEEYWDDEDEDDEDDGDYYGQYTSVLERDAEYRRLVEWGSKYFEVMDGGLDEEMEAAMGLGGGYGGRDRDEFEEEKLGDFALLDYATDCYVSVNKDVPKREKRKGGFIAPQLRQLFLQDQGLRMKDIQILKKARRGVQVFHGESCGDGYAAQHVYSMVGNPGGWY